MLTIMYNSIKTWQTSSKKQLSQTVEQEATNSVSNGITAYTSYRVQN